MSQSRFLHVSVSAYQRISVSASAVTPADTAMLCSVLLCYVILARVCCPSGLVGEEKVRGGVYITNCGIKEIPSSMNAEEALLWYKNKGSPVRDNTYYVNVSVMTFRAIRHVGSLPLIDREVCGLFFLAIVNSYGQTFRYSSVHVNHTILKS